MMVFTRSQHSVVVEAYKSGKSPSLPLPSLADELQPTRAFNAILVGHFSMLSRTI